VNDLTNDLTQEADWLLGEAMKRLGDSGIPVDETISGSGTSRRTQQVVRRRLEEMTAGVRR